jgi:exonuclease III
MSYTYKLVTLNINGIASNTRVRMLEGFLWRQDVDFELLQEVKYKTIDTIQNYTAYVNAGTNNRGTAILAKKGLPITNIKRIP